MQSSHNNAAVADNTHQNIPTHIFADGSRYEGELVFHTPKKGRKGRNLSMEFDDATTTESPPEDDAALGNKNERALRIAMDAAIEKPFGEGFPEADVTMIFKLLLGVANDKTIEEGKREGQVIDVVSALRDRGSDFPADMKNTIVQSEDLAPIECFVFNMGEAAKDAESFYGAGAVPPNYLSTEEFNKWGMAAVEDDDDDDEEEEEEEADDDEETASPATSPPWSRVEREDLLKQIHEAAKVCGPGGVKFRPKHLENASVEELREILHTLKEGAKKIDEAISQRGKRKRHDDGGAATSGNKKRGATA
jgi:hypothetical protein